MKDFVMNKTLKKLLVTGAFISAAFALNDNKVAAQGVSPSGVNPKAPVTNIDSTAKSGADTLRANFKANSPDADTGTKKKVITPDMPLDDQSRIYSRNNDGIGIAIFVGKDMAKYTHEQIAEKFEQFCRERGVQAKAFVGNGYSEDGNTVYAIHINGHLVYGIEGGKNLFDNEIGLPSIIRAQKGYDLRKKRAAMELSN
jgi:hypothetical protein